MNENKSVFRAVTMTVLLMLFIGTSVWAILERKQTVTYKNEIEQLKIAADSLAKKQAIDVIMLQQVVEKMASDIVTANKSSESDLVQQAIENLQVTVHAKNDTVPKK